VRITVPAGPGCQSAFHAVSTWSPGSVMTTCQFSKVELPWLTMVNSPWKPPSQTSGVEYVIVTAGPGDAGAGAAGPGVGDAAGAGDAGAGVADGAGVGGGVGEELAGR